MRDDFFICASAAFYKIARSAFLHCSLLIANYLASAAKAEKQKSLASHLYQQKDFSTNATKVKRQKIFASHLYFTKAISTIAEKAEKSKTLGLPFPLSHLTPGMV